MADRHKTFWKQATGMECEGLSIMAPNGSCERMQENPRFQQSVSGCAFHCLSAAASVSRTGGRMSVVRNGG